MAFANHTSDGSFFVESDDQRMSMQDAVKMLARNKQEMIANELSRLAHDEYLEDIMQHMRHLEVSNFFPIALLPRTGGPYLLLIYVLTIWNRTKLYQMPT